MKQIWAISILKKYKMMGSAPKCIHLMLVCIEHRIVYHNCIKEYQGIFIAQVFYLSALTSDQMVKLAQKRSLGIQELNSFIEMIALKKAQSTKGEI